MTDLGPDTGTDDAAVLAVIAGEVGPWERLVGLWARRVFAAAQSRLRDADAAEEVTQSVMVTVFQHISEGRYTHTGQFESWLFRIAMNRVRDVIRRSQRHTVRSLNDSHQALGGQAVPDESTELDALRDVLASLPEADQEVISLRHHAQLGFATIAEMLGEPLGTVLARHHRAVAKIRAIMEPRARDRTREDPPLRAARKTA